MTDNDLNLVNLLNTMKISTLTDADSNIVLKVLEKVRQLYEADTYTILLENLDGKLCPSYPPFIVVPAYKKV